jgi:hypothetical protein
MGRVQTAFWILVSFLVCATQARAAGPAQIADPLAAACHAGAGFSSLGDQIFRREAELLSLMARETALLGPLEKTKSKFELYDQTLTAAEFSLASLALNGIVLGALAKGGSAVDTVGAVATANKLATLRQVINGTIGTAGIVWAASYHSDYGDMLPDSVGAQDIEKATIREEITHGFGSDTAYVSAQRHLSNMIEYYSKLDNSVRLREIDQHELHLDLNSPSHVEQTKDCDLQLRLGAEMSSCDSERMWRVVRLVLPKSNYFHQKTQDTMIDLAAVQSHLKVFIEELRFLSSLYGQLLAHCELKNDVLATGASPVTAESVWDGMLKYSKEIKQLPNGQTAPALPAGHVQAAR